MNHNIKTGDILLFSGNTPTGFMLKTLTSSIWNHVGIAVRFNENKEITLDSSGELYVLETNTGVRKDHLSDEIITGVGYSKYKYSSTNYNRISVRHLKEKYRNQDIIEITNNFYLENKKIKFPDETMPFINVFLGFKIWDSQCTRGDNKFCSQLSIEYYHKILKKYDDKVQLENILEGECPMHSELYTPEHFSYNVTPNSEIFENILEQDIYIQNSHITYIILQILIMIFAFVALLYLILEYFIGNK